MIPETGSIKTELTYPVWGQNRNQIVNSDCLLRIADNHRDAYPENLPVFYPMQNTNFQNTISSISKMQIPLRTDGEERHRDPDQALETGEEFSCQGTDGVLQVRFYGRGTEVRGIERRHPAYARRHLPTESGR